jgi:protein required for attachment to host cells
MQKLKIQAHEWVVVCDGRKALILENVGDDKFPNLRCREEYEHEDLPTHAQGTSEPGRMQQSMGPRSAIEQTDWHDEAERAFLAKLGHRLNAAVTNGETKTMIVVASPRALGMLRQDYSAAVKHAIRAEIHKDYVKAPIHEIERHLFG